MEISKRTNSVDMMYNKIIMRNFPERAAIMNQSFRLLINSMNNELKFGNVEVRI